MTTPRHDPSEEISTLTEEELATRKKEIYTAAKTKIKRLKNNIPQFLEAIRKLSDSIIKDPEHAEKTSTEIQQFILEEMQAKRLSLLPDVNPVGDEIRAFTGELLAQPQKSSITYILNQLDRLEELVNLQINTIIQEAENGCRRTSLESMRDALLKKQKSHESHSEQWNTLQRQILELNKKIKKTESEHVIIQGEFSALEEKLSGDLQSSDPLTIKWTLNSLLDSVTQPEVLSADEEFQRLRDRKAKSVFLKDFKASQSGLLERWTHYSWLRLELSYLASQRAMLNRIRSARIKSQKNHVDFPLVESIQSAIQEDALSGMPIEKSIATLRKITLQIVGTEHPTDPLSQSARDKITEIANEMEKAEPDEAKIKVLLAILQQTDAIPPFKRTVEEEVNRNIGMALSKLYDSLPQFVQSILDAYQQSYGKDLFEKHKEEILRALEGGLQLTENDEVSTPIVRHASWTGFDADGNDNVTPDAMRNAIQLHRTRIAEKHIASLEKTIIAASKTAERRLREEILQLSKNRMKLLNEIGDGAAKLREDFYDFDMSTAGHLINRNFDALVSGINQQDQYIQGLALDSESLQPIQDNYHLQYAKALLLKNLTRFSGAYWVTHTHQDRAEQNTGTLEKGDLQKLQALLYQFKEKILNNTDEIDIASGQTQTEYVLGQYRKILNDHQDLFTALPELQLPMHYFGIQLSCFGMTYGIGHVRQDSSVFIKVWDTLLKDLCQDERFSGFSIFKALKEKGYQGLTTEERTCLHKRLQDSDPEGSQILQAIRKTYEAGTYHKQQEKPGFNLVCRELERVKLALRHSDMFENIIISNCESAANILEVESLLNIFGSERRIIVVPLLEKRQDLENYEHILTDFMKMQRERGISTVEIMIGYSDTERVSGLPALISIQEVQEKIIKLAAKFGLQVKFYHGPGGDANRGGLGRRDEKATLQGKARSDMLTTPESTARFCETQFYRAYKDKSRPSQRMEFEQLPLEELRQKLEICKKQGADFYEHLHDTEKGLGKLLALMLGRGAHWMVDILNSSSRASQRGRTDNHGDRTISVQTGGARPKSYVKLADLRAITATQMKELLRDNIHLLMGPGYGLRAIGDEEATSLYHFSKTFRDMIDKTAMGWARTDFMITYLALFGENSEFFPKNDKARQEWAEECRTTYPDLLKNMDIEKMAKEDSNNPLLLTMLSRLLAYMMEESLQTSAAILNLYRASHPGKYPPTLQRDSLLAYHPEWEQQEKAVMCDADLPQLLLAWQNFHVAQGENLDEVYAGLNEESRLHSRLTGMGRLLGATGAAMTSARGLLPPFYEPLYRPDSAYLKPSEERAKREQLQMYGLSGSSALFGERKQQLQQSLADTEKRDQGKAMLARSLRGDG